MRFFKQTGITPSEATYERLAELYVQLKETAIEIEDGKQMQFVFGAIEREIERVKIALEYKYQRAEQKKNATPRKIDRTRRTCKVCGRRLPIKYFHATHPNVCHRCVIIQNSEKYVAKHKK